MNTVTSSLNDSSLHSYPKRWFLILGMMLAGLTPLGHVAPDSRKEGQRSGERGAVSLEQVLWFVAAGISVAVIAGILWTQIRTQASTPINVPSAP
jgi:hypothetical protein